VLVKDLREGLDATNRYHGLIGAICIPNVVEIFGLVFNDTIALDNVTYTPDLTAKIKTEASTMVRFLRVKRFGCLGKPGFWLGMIVVEDTPSIPLVGGKN
jgi:hypothetical protein